MSHLCVKGYEQSASCGTHSRLQYSRCGMCVSLCTQPIYVCLVSNMRWNPQWAESCLIWFLERQMETQVWIHPQYVCVCVCVPISLWHIILWVSAVLCVTFLQLLLWTMVPLVEWGRGHTVLETNWWPSWNHRPLAKNVLSLTGLWVKLTVSR